MGLNVLIIDRAPPIRLTQGNELIARRVFPLLREHHLTLVAPMGGSPDAAAVQAAANELGDAFDEVRLVPRTGRVTSLAGGLEPGVSAFVGRVPALARRLPGSLDPAFPRLFREAIADVLRERRPDVVHVRQLPMAAYAASTDGRPALLELIDSEILGTARLRDGSLRGVLRHLAAGAMERSAVRRFPLVTTVADADAAAIRASVPDARVEVVPNGVDAAFFNPAALAASDPSVDAGGAVPEPGLVVFVGAMSFAPNVAAVGWFARQVLPLLVARAPHVRFAIVGRDPAPEVSALASDPRVTVTGMVDDVRPWLARASVVVVPMVSGSGIKNKLLEALAMARPVVATPLAVEGLHLIPGRELLVADGADEFAAQVARVLTEPAEAERIGGAGRAAVEATYTWSAAAARYDALWRELAARPQVQR